MQLRPARHPLEQLVYGRLLAADAFGPTSDEDESGFFQLFLRVSLDHKVVQLFENLLTIVDGTEHIKYLVSNIEHELAPYQHFQTNIS